MLAPRPKGSNELRRVYREHLDAVYAFFAYSVSRHTAEDLTSATFERVVRAWSSYDPTRSAERTWILAIARNLLTDHFRRGGKRQESSIDERPELLERNAEEGQIERILSQDELRGWLSILDERERAVVALRYGADLPASDIAELLDLSVANVHQIASRSLRRLRDHAGEGVSVSGSALRSA